MIGLDALAAGTGSSHTFEQTFARYAKYGPVNAPRMMVHDTSSGLYTLRTMGIGGAR